jgi:hypothetical protein
MKGETNVGRQLLSFTRIKDVAGNNREKQLQYGVSSRNNS